MIYKSLDLLHPTLRALAQTMLNEWADTHPDRHPIVITETWRDPARENDLRMKGITRATGKSCEHCFMLDGKPASRAFDFLLYEDGKPITDGSDEWYEDAGAIAKKLGLVWGGDFTHPDYDHVELPTEGG